VLLHFSGIESEVKEGKEFTEWSIMTDFAWKPEMRYSQAKWTNEGFSLIVIDYRAYSRRMWLRFKKKKSR